MFYHDNMKTDAFTTQTAAGNKDNEGEHEVSSRENTAQHDRC